MAAGIVPRLLEPPARSFFLFWRTDDGVEVMSVARFNESLATGL